MPADTNPRVLVVDDEPSIRKSLDMMLSMHGYQVGISANGKEALNIIERDRPDLVLSDVNMPRMDGLEFLRIIKADAALKRIPVIVLTTSQEECDRSASFELGAAGYVRKPVDFAKFVDAMRVVNHYWTLSELP